MSTVIQFLDRKQEALDRKTRVIFHEIDGITGAQGRRIILPELVVVAYGLVPEETLANAELDIVSLGWLDEKKNLIVPPMLLDCLTRTSNDSFSYALRPSCLDIFNVGLDEVGTPRVPKGNRVQAEAPAVYVWHYDRELVLGGRPGFGKK